MHGEEFAAFPLFNSLKHGGFPGSNQKTVSNAPAVTAERSLRGEEYGSNEHSEAVESEVT